VSSTRYYLILIKLEFSRPILENNTQLPNFKKAHSVGVELFHADGQTDRHGEASRFRNFANALKNLSISVLTFAVSVNYDAVLSESVEEGLYTICIVNRTFGSACLYRTYVKR